jgi:hypothetical protein
MRGGLIQRLRTIWEALGLKKGKIGLIHMVEQVRYLTSKIKTINTDPVLGLESVFNRLLICRHPTATL